MNCPFCEEPIWGEGWNPKNQERFYSHVSPTQNVTCAYELGLMPDGKWNKYSREGKKNEATDEPSESTLDSRSGS